MVAWAYLRVFQPLDRLPEAERVQWERYIVQGPVSPTRRVYRERRTSGRGRFGLLTSDEDRADVRLVGGRWYVCPWRTPLRVLASILTLRETVSEEMADALVPEAEARRAGRALQRIRRRDPRAVPAMLESPWHVPVRWFVLFGDAERQIAERDDGGYRLSYWTGLPDARKRARRAIEVLEGGELAPVASIVHDLDDWLSCFNEECSVELDYGNVCDAMGWNDLDEDHSAREVQGAVDALGRSDPERAGELYQAVTSRWAEARIRESLN